MNKKKEIPVYLQLIQNVRAGFSILDPSIQQEIIDFINSQQHQSGGFVNRAGHVDLYYSLFGHWICRSIGLDKQSELLKQFISNRNESTTNPVDQISLALIKAELFPKKKKPKIISLLKLLYKNRFSIDWAYNFFLLALFIDTMGKHKTLYFLLARTWLLFYKLGDNTPCSVLAALVYAKKMVRVNFKKEELKLITFITESGGFKTFVGTNGTDMLSTGVSLFVLQKTGYDLDLIRPGSLNFVEQNYNSGAFLAGNGDDVKDIEYTFYGLLALGSLTENEKKA